ncbi:unnamed protein product, partial [Medioppia subpectinata]
MGTVGATADTAITTTSTTTSTAIPTTTTGATPTAMTDADAANAKVFVGRLPDGCTEKDLEDLFRTYGTVKQTDLIGKYGFVVTYRHRRIDPYFHTTRPHITHPFPSLY